MSRKWFPTLLLVALAFACKSSHDKHAMKKPEDKPAASAIAADPKLPGIEQADGSLMERLQTALRNRGTGYKPRTHHLNADGTAKFINRLILSDSPYLLQHAHNPVNWFPWGDEAFARAKADDKPIFLSIGYSTCHWCHVMEGESFEDEEIAAYLNTHFIAIKVDREQRPDVDAIYMRAVQMLTGHGGWPMTVIMTPDRKPFFAGTYFPPREGKHRRGPGLRTVLKTMQKAYATDRTRVIDRAKELSRHVAQSLASQKPGLIPDSEPIERLAQLSARREDPQFGGFGSAPKFPRPALPELLLRYHRRSKDELSLQIVERALQGMLRGGLYDHLGGGFHRYSTDAQWLVPHFEKMLYDNAQLVVLLLHAYQLTNRDDFRSAAQQTLQYVQREMTDEAGGFYSATDADSETPSGTHEEGYYFTWTPKELSTVLGEQDGRILAAYFGVSAQGNLDGRSTLTRQRDQAEIAKELSLSVAQLRQKVLAATPKLLAARSQRIAPSCDRKVLVAWNGLMIGAFAQGGVVLGDDGFVQHAEKAATFILSHMRDDKARLLRSYFAGHADHLAFLDDHAFLIAGLLDLLEATAKPKYLEGAMELQKALDSGFWDAEHGGYFMTSKNHEELLVREKPIYDGAEPSGNAIALLNLLRLWQITGNDEYHVRAEKALAAFAHDIVEDPGASPAMLSALEHYLDRPRDVFVVRPADAADDADKSFMDVIRQSYAPNLFLIRAKEGVELDELSKHIPALKEKVAIDDKVTAYVCEQGRCELPARSASTLRSQLSQVTPLPRD